MRHTKIVATVGPATSSEPAIRELITAGVDVFRLNFSHGTHVAHGEAIDCIRRAAAQARRCVAILQDLSGPKIRTGPLAGGLPLTLSAGDALTIAVGDFAGGSKRVSTTYAQLPEALHRGDTLLLDDGHIQLRVESTTHSEVQTTVVDGGVLGERKGINAPGVELPSASLTEKDIDDLRFGVAASVDFVALSFVRSAADLKVARELLRKRGAERIPLVAKLERPEAVSRIDEILRASDAVMVARGDLGLELPLEHVPRVQKAVTRRARALGVPVIVATQVLESMRTEPRPTRAEVSDAANAVDDGVDAIMLAGETAVGAFPIKAVETLDRIIRDAESIPPVGPIPLEDAHMLPPHGHAICQAAITLAVHADAAAIVAVTRGGKTARVLSALRPRVPIFAAIGDERIGRRLVLSRGVFPVLADLQGDLNAAAASVGRDLVQRDLISASSAIVIVSVTPDLAPGPSNFVKVQTV